MITYDEQTCDEQTYDGRVPEPSRKRWHEGGKYGSVSQNEYTSEDQTSVDDRPVHNPSDPDEFVSRTEHAAQERSAPLMVEDWSGDTSSLHLPTPALPASIVRVATMKVDQENVYSEEDTQPYTRSDENDSDDERQHLDTPSAASHRDPDPSIRKLRMNLKWDANTFHV